MANPILSYFAIAATMEGINAQINRYSSRPTYTQTNTNQLVSGIFGGIAVAPVFFMHQTIKASTQQFPAEKTIWKAVKNYLLSDLGQNWNRYANLQGAFAWRGAALGAITIGLKTAHKNLFN